MSETTLREEQELREREQRAAVAQAETMARLCEIADEARALAATHATAEERLELLEETDPPPARVRAEEDPDDELVTPPDPMPPLYEDMVPEPEEAEGTPALSWGTAARAASALITAALAGWSGAHLADLSLSLAEGATSPPTTVLWVPGLLIALAVSGSAIGLRRGVPGTPEGVRWSVFAVTVFFLGTASLSALIGLWLWTLTGEDPLLAGLGALAGLVAALAQVPARIPRSEAAISPGALLGGLREFFRGARRRRQEALTIRRWRRTRSRARAAIRAHVAAWQAVHHRCHTECELGNAQAEQLAQALFVLRGNMFGAELPGDSETAPGVPPLVGHVEVAVHNLTVHHPDRLLRRLKHIVEGVGEEE
ncbi:hypothetical protein [Nocardiopsis lambiniae]|uniref:Uncharacterized protein n=1 Tax=Nocardiopsis lambiniae TaxID=3075539 RepID=A0ABU2MGG3_9ACTN|nr:hypothetical protein [Nocardiopsis sp. DSM 44743]MDT0331732.1 hypothetical protein [Nocardiopsis sp. DSM 44743]